MSQSLRSFYSVETCVGLFPTGNLFWKQNLYHSNGAFQLQTGRNIDKNGDAEISDDSDSLRGDDFVANFNTRGVRTYLLFFVAGGDSHIANCLFHSVFVCIQALQTLVQLCEQLHCELEETPAAY